MTIISKMAVALALACAACPASTPPPEARHAELAGVSALAEPIYDGHLLGGWIESGSAPRDSVVGGGERVRFSNAAEWVLTRPGLDGPFGGVLFRVKEPYGEGEFLEVRLGSSDGHTHPSVKLKPDHRTELSDGWTRVFVPMAELNPDGTPFDRLIFRSFRPLGDDWISFDKIALAQAAGPPLMVSKPSASVAPAPAATPAAANAARVRMRVSCDAKATKISPFIYGIAYGDPGWETLGATARRWGGNATTRYNWETHFNNRARDWFFENHPGSSYAEFVQSSAEHSALTALTVPTIGWVAKDGTSYSFPVSVYGPQGKTDQWNPDAGNGVTTAGLNIEPGPPTRTSTEAPPEWIKRWVATVRASEANDGKRSVYEYILDNEPMLWHDTHRDVHPAPVGYDELLDRTIRYGSAVRAADSDAIIAGPAEWGWPAYFDSAKDLAGHQSNHADRHAHGDVPLVEWYLRKLREHEQKTHTRVLDVLDLHYYPQASNVFSGAADKDTQLLRLRSTRSLWDAAYVDESWIKEPIRLLPRMKEWVEKNYPGRGISIGEWNFGGEQDITGALAIAEALGRFAQFGVTSAFYWTAPPHGSPGSFGFLAYRNFDGKGGHFLDWFVPAASSDDVSLFASRDAEGKHLVVVAVNMARDAAVLADLDVSTCGTVASQQAYQYARGAQGFEASGSTSPTALAPWSTTAIDIRLR